MPIPVSPGAEVKVVKKLDPRQPMQHTHPNTLFDATGTYSPGRHGRGYKLIPRESRFDQPWNRFDRIDAD